MLVSIALAAEPNHAEDLAVVVANERYVNLEPVLHARRDADAVAAWLVGTAGLPNDSVARVDDATGEQILAAVSKAAAVTPRGATLWVYYAGHGVAVESDRRTRRALLGVDVVDDGVIGRQVLRLSDVEDAAAKAGKAVLLLETSFDGKRAGLPVVQFAMPAPPLKARRHVTTWTAGNQGVQVYDAARHGAFTWFVLAGLSGAATPASAETVSIGQVQAWLPGAMASAGVEGQTPELVGSADLTLRSSGRALILPSSPDRTSDRDLALAAGRRLEASGRPLGIQRPTPEELAALDSRVALQRGGDLLHGQHRPRDPSGRGGWLGEPADLDLAIELFASYLEVNPHPDEEANIRIGMGTALQHRGHLEEAVAAYRMILEDHPASDAAPDAARSLWSLLSRQGDTSGIAELTAMVLDRYPTSPIALTAGHKAAETQFVRGDTRAAVDTLKRVLDRYDFMDVPGHPGRGDGSIYAWIRNPAMKDLSGWFAVGGWYDEAAVFFERHGNPELIPARPEIPKNQEP